MKPRHFALCIGLAATLAGCASTPRNLGADPTQIAQLEFVKGHPPTRLGRIGSEVYIVCKTVACKRDGYIYMLQLQALTSDQIVRPAPSGDVYITAVGNGYGAGFSRHCRLRVHVKLEAAHNYRIKLQDDIREDYCHLIFTDKSTGESIPMERMELAPE